MTMHRRNFCAALAGLAAAPVTAREPAALFDAQGYRIDRYRAPVPIAPDGVRRVGVAEVQRALGAKTPVLDVMPATGAGFDRRTGMWRLSERHDHLPDTLWFPEVGRGRPEPVIEAWFRRAVSRLTGGQSNAPAVVYCRSDCWMSWNAAKRLTSWGYTNILWFADGIEGWSEAGLQLVPAVPQRVDVGPTSD